MEDYNDEGFCKVILFLSCKLLKFLNQAVINWIEKETLGVFFGDFFRKLIYDQLCKIAGNMILFQIKVFARNHKSNRALLFYTLRSH